MRRSEILEIQKQLHIFAERKRKEMNHRFMIQVWWWRPLISQTTSAVAACISEMYER